MQGQYSNDEFVQMYAASNNAKGCNIGNGTAWIRYGKSTINYYTQHSDGSWTNYDCKTVG